MSKWQEILLSKFKAYHAQSIVVIDQDQLMQDDYLISRLQNREYDIINFSKEVNFRNEYEQSYRSLWDEGIRTQMIVIVQSQTESNELPFDIYTKSRILKISLVDLFPQLHYLVVKSLDKAYYQALFNAHNILINQNKNYRKSIKDTSSFILRSVFNLDAISIQSVEKLIKLLIEKHSAYIDLPKPLQEQIIEEIQHSLKSEFDLVKAFEDSSYFFRWLQDQWDRYVDYVVNNNSYPENILNFQNNELQFIRDNLFTEGKLKKYELKRDQTEKITKLRKEFHWIAVGIVSKNHTGMVMKEKELVDIYALNSKFSYFKNLDQELNLRQWLNIGYDFGQMVYQYTTLSVEQYEELKNEFEIVRNVMNSKFREFLVKSYSSISFYDDNKGPISLAKINQYINKHRRDKERIAMLVLDGMAIDQWFLVKQYLEEKCGLMFEENKTYAVTPTITSISRQALFSGKLPRHFSDSLYNTSKEEKHWSDYWVNKGVRRKRINYTNLKITDEMKELKEIVDSKNEILGIVVNFIDDIMHKTKDIKAGKRFFYDTLESYLKHSHLDKLINLLIQSNYKVYITSDHGNIHGFGNGIQVPKDLIETYAKRTTLYDREVLAKDFAIENDQFLYKPTFLPENIFPVYSKDNSIYAKNGITEISHGGLSIEEMMVPFIEVKKNDDRL